MAAFSVIRFARPDAPTAPAPRGAVVVARVLLGEPAVPVGQIVQRATGWDYQLADGSASGLTSTESRQDLEHQIVLYHLGPLPAAEANPALPPLKLAM